MNVSPKTDVEEKQHPAIDLDEKESDFIPHRVFINHVDSYHGKIISNIIADQTFPDEQEEEEVGEEMGEEEVIVPKEPEKPKIKYEIVGTAKNQRYVKTEDVTLVIDDKLDYNEEIMKCGFVIFDITHNKEELPKALSTLQAMEVMLDKIHEETPKKFQSMKERRVFILISTIMTWANTKPVDPDDPDVSFVETDFRKRKPHPNYKDHIALEKEVIQRGKKYKGKLVTVVVACGVTYGFAEENLHILFKMAWMNSPELPIITSGNNTIPLLHMKDLASILIALMANVPKKPKYILGVEQTMSKQKQIVKAISKCMGRGRTKTVNKEEAFLVPELSQVYFDRMTINLKMEPGYVVNELGINYQSEMNLCENINAIAREYKMSRNLQPVRILLHGPPAVGKTTLAKKLCKIYDLHYISVASLVEKTIAEMNENIEYVKAKMKLKEAKAEQENTEEEEAEEEEDDEEEDSEGALEEMIQKVKEIQHTLNESESGKLPDETIIQFLKDKLLSNPCQNQGYLLDGFPKTSEQARQVFDISAEDQGQEAEEEAEGEEGEGGEETKKIILPQYVVSLEASDEYICRRLMIKPESEIQGTEYTEERMVARLTEYRADNTEDNTLLNIFDEMEIHPILINANTDNHEPILELLKTKIGEKKGYPLSEEVLNAMRLAEEERLEEEAKIREEERRQLEQLMIQEKQANMEKWMDMFHTLQQEEEQILVAQNKPLREYLMKFIFPTLTRGLLECTR